MQSGRRVHLVVVVVVVVVVSYCAERPVSPGVKKEEQDVKTTVADKSKSMSAAVAPRSTTATLPRYPVSRRPCHCLSCTHSLPARLRNATSLLTFRRQLRTFLSNESLPAE